MYYDRMFLANPRKSSKKPAPRRKATEEVEEEFFVDASVLEEVLAPAPRRRTKPAKPAAKPAPRRRKKAAEPEVVAAPAPSRRRTKPAAKPAAKPAPAPVRRRSRATAEPAPVAAPAPARRRSRATAEPAPVAAPAPARRRSRATAEPAPVAAPAPAPAPSRRRSGASAGFPTGGVMLAKKHTGADVRGWWMSEKFDGMRAYWTGSEFFTRNGNKIYTPKWFTDALPDMALDGELMLGRGKFQETMSIVRKHTPVDKDWRRITYYVFDAPMERGGCEARWDAAKRAVRGIGHVKMVEQVACKSPAHLKQVHDEIAALGGEGVMLREPGSAYEHRRSSRLLKVKMFDDNEARITGYEAGKGKHAGRLGAYEAVLTTGPHKGKSFTVGTGMSDEERERPLRIGTIITVKHQGYSNSGHPRFPSFLRARGRE